MLLGGFLVFSSARARAADRLWQQSGVTVVSLLSELEPLPLEPLPVIVEEIEVDTERRG